MFKKILAGGLLLSCFSMTAFGGWFTQVEDDVFTGGKKAMLGGDIGPNHGLLFNCDSDGLTMSFLERRADDEPIRSREFNLVVKVDGQPVRKFSGSSSIRNKDWWHIETNDSDGIVQLLEELKSAQSKVLVGIQAVGFDNKWSGTANASGSTRETERFLKACQIKIKS